MYWSHPVITVLSVLVIHSGSGDGARYYDNGPATPGSVEHDQEDTVSIRYSMCFLVYVSIHNVCMC